MLCMVLLAITQNVLISNISARVISSIVNFALNKRFVFKKKGNLLRSAISYFILAAFILAGNTFVLYLLVNVCHIDGWLAKLITEACFFVISWSVQKFIIFRNKKKQ